MLLADAYCFAGGGPVPDSGLVLGRGLVRCRVVRLGGLAVRKVRSNAAGPLDERDVHMYRDSSIAPLLDLRRRLKIVLGVLSGMIRGGFSLTRSLELTTWWDCIHWAGPAHPISAQDLLRVQVRGLAGFMKLSRCFTIGSRSSFTGSWYCVGMKLLEVGEIGLGRIPWCGRTGG